MTIDPNIRDQAYQFFIEEASELLDIIETGLLNLRPEVTVPKVHEIMRAAHSIKGGAASVDLDTIKTIAHRLEDAFKALYSDTVIVDAELETLLLRAYDCLRHPLQSQIVTGTFNEKQALAAFELIFSELENRLGSALDATDSFMPSAVDLGVDIVASIFEVDVAEVLTRLRDVLAHPHNYNCDEELQIQIEILAGFAELIDLSGFTTIIATAQTAAAQHLNQPLPVIEQVLQDVDNARTAILGGARESLDRPSDSLLAMASGPIAGPDDLTDSDASVSRQIDDFDLADLDLDALDEPANHGIAPTLDPLDTATNQVSSLEEIWSIEAMEFPSVEKLDDEIGSVSHPPDIQALEDIWGNAEEAAATLDVEVTDFEAVMTESSPAPLIEHWSDLPSPELEIAENIADGSETLNLELPQLAEDSPNTVDSAINFIGTVYDSLPRLSTEITPAPVDSTPDVSQPVVTSTSKPRLSAKVALDRLERMDNLVGELSINRNSLSLQNDQFQRTVHKLGQRFLSFRTIVKQLQNLSDQILIAPERTMAGTSSNLTKTAFDSLEMDSYGEINLLLEEILEEVFQLAESIDDVGLFAGQSNQLLEHQRRTLTQLRDQLMWSRMVPLDRVLKRFPRVIRELVTTYQKPVQLKLTGTEVLVDRVMLEKLYDPLLHLLRNAFSHGIEAADKRRSLGKPAEGTIEIRAYHRGNYTVIDISDDGQGLDIDRIAQRAVEVQLRSPEQLTAMSKQQIQQLIFEPGFSTASKVSELSGRGVGLDIVRESLQAFNGKILLTTRPAKGTLFSLKIPLTLTLTKLIVGSIGTTAVALASEGIEEILKPSANQLKYAGGKQFLYWREQLIPVYDLAEHLNYHCQVPEQLPQELQGRDMVQGQNTMLIVQQGQGQLALGLEQIVTEQELVIKPLGKAVAAPSYVNGCTVLADGSLVPVIDGAALVQFEAKASMQVPTQSLPPRAQTLMIIDDSSALRRTLALTLGKAGYQVLQAKDGRDAVEQLQRGALPNLIICDVEMPRLNGFEFLSQRRANADWAEIPTVMLTSRGNHKHQTLARHLGATDYFTKPYIEKEFVGAIATLLQQQP
ncbi:MAG: hybrid sensor histidine kinase/response regulator [Cyanobacteria bacterium J06554_1]